MSLKEKLLEHLKEAMRSRDEVRRSTIRLLRAAIQNEEIARGRDLDDPSIQEIISREARRRRESIEQFRLGQRQDLVEREEAELSILLGYLPQQMSREEIQELARQIIQEVGAQGSSDKGKVMGRIMPQVRGRAQGAEVNAAVDELLQSQG